MGMWWEIVPVFSVCMGLCALPYWLTRGYNKVTNGTGFQRGVVDSNRWYLYQRDRDHSAHAGLSLSRRSYNKDDKVGSGNIFKSHGLEKYD